MRKLNVCILQHSKNTPPGSCAQWLESRGHKTEVIRLHEGDALPDLSQVDWLIILGGPMNVDDVDLHPWLAQEKALLKKAVAEGVPCLGLCLGGQLLSQTLGGRVTKNSHWELGWHEVEIQQKKLPKKLTVFQFHQDQFSLPPGAERLATNKITENQGFTYRDHVVGLQFHPESTESWVRYCAFDKAHPGHGTYVQTPEQIIEGLSNLPAMQEWFFNLLLTLEARAQAR